MPFALGIIGLLLIVAGARGTYGELKNLLVDDFTGERNFFYWIVALGVAGALGYLPGFEKLSRAFMALIIISMVIAQSKQKGSGGFFEKFMAAIEGLKNGAGSDGSGSGGLNDWYKGLDPRFFGGQGGNAPNGVEEMNKRFGKPPEWITGGARWLLGAE